MTAAAGPEAVETPALRRLGAAVAPMSFAQERLWLIDQAAPGSATYNVPLLTRWREPIDPAALAAALGAVVARHEVLRTTYALDGDQPVQRVGAPAPVAVEVLDGGSWVDEEVACRARQPFDLAAGPVLRATVWRGAPSGDLMLLVVHHIAIDGWSLATLYHDLAAAYRAALAGQPPRLPELPIQYADFARWDRETFTGARRQRLATRADELRDIPELVLAGARPAPPVPEGDPTGRQETFAVPAHLWAGVERLARTLRATPFVVLHAAFQVVLHRWSGRDELIAGVVTGNRPHPDVEPLVGFFVNTVPLRCEVRPEWTFRQLCARVRVDAYRLLSDQWVPFDRLTSAVAAVRAGGHQRLVDACFALQNMPPVRVEPARWEPPTVLATGTAKFGLLLIVEETAAGVTGTVELDAGRYPDEVCRGVVTTFLDVLAAVTADADVPLRAVPLPAVPVRAVPLPAVPVPAVPVRAMPAAAVPVAAVPVAAVAPDGSVGTVADGPVDAVCRRHAAELFAAALGTVERGAPGGDRTALRPDSNFFALGGHSLLAVTMLARAGRRHGVAVSPREFLAEPTVAGLARLLAAGRTPATVDRAGGDGTGGGGGTGDGGTGGGSRDRYPATSAQQRFWFLDRIPALRSAYLMPTVLELRGAVDRDALCRAVDRVMARHPALGSRFELDRKRRAVCYRTGGVPAPTTRTDASTWPADRLRDHVAELCWAPFDLAAGAPVRTAVIARGASRTLLVLVVHHIVADGWSRRLLLDEIAAGYRACLAGREPALATPVHPDRLYQAPAADQTADLIAWLTRAPVDVWLPHDRPRPDVQSTVAATAAAVLDTEGTARLRAVAAGAACTVFTVTAALLAVALARLGAQRDFLFAFPWAGRDAAGAAEAVGMLVNTSVLRVDLRGVRTWRELLARVRDSAAVSYRTAGASFEAVAAALHPDRDLSRPPLTPVYLGADDGPLAPPVFGGDVRASYRPLDPYHIKYELELTATEDRDRLRFTASYAVGLFDGETIAGLLAQLVAAAGDLTSDPDTHPLEGLRCATQTTDQAATR
ncbi:MAG TPA: condensation domain-containing protein [Micromonosporaceae bacterium]|nr:condensation domain-containing protein [Micromonosporaceae bacterium]